MHVDYYSEANYIYQIWLSFFRRMTELYILALEYWPGCKARLQSENQSRHYLNQFLGYATMQEHHPKLSFSVAYSIPLVVPVTLLHCKRQQLSYRQPRSYRGCYCATMPEHQPSSFLGCFHTPKKTAFQVNWQLQLVLDGRCHLDPASCYVTMPKRHLKLSSCPLQTRDLEELVVQQRWLKSKATYRLIREY